MYLWVIHPTIAPTTYKQRVPMIDLTLAQINYFKNQTYYHKTYQGVSRTMMLGTPFDVQVVEPLVLKR
jgi:hypothetical protein